MRYLIALAVLAAAIVFSFRLSDPLVESWRIDNQHQQELNQQDEQRRQFDEQQRQQQQRAQQPGDIAAHYGLYVFLAVLSYGVLTKANDFYNQRRVPLARFDAERPLVARTLIENGDTDLIRLIARSIELTGQAQIARAVHQPGQQSHSYAPHVTITSPKAAPLAELPMLENQPTPEAERPQLQLLPGECTLAGLQRTGIIARSGNSLHVGNAVADGTPIYLELATWGALALGGKSRTGKTSRTVYYLAQATLNGWRLVVCDKHGGGGKQDALLSKAQMLENSFLLPAAVSQADINKRISQVYQIGKRRLDNADTSRYPILLIVDEFTNLVINDWLTDTTLDQLMSIANEHAGVNVHALIIGHDWSASCLGKERGAAFRRITTHRIAHRLDAQGAQFLLPSGMGKTAESLTVGQALFVDETGEPILVDCPLLHDEDLRYAAEHSGRYIGTHQGTPAETGGKHPGSTLEAPPETAVSTHQDAPAPTTDQRETQVRQMLREKASQREIISTLWGASSGRGYQQAADELREILASIAGGA